MPQVRHGWICLWHDICLRRNEECRSRKARQVLCSCFKSAWFRHGDFTQMKIGIACGGTGGHVFPGLATAEILRARGHEIVLWVSGRAVEKEALGAWNGPVIAVHVCGFPLRPGIRYFGALLLLWRALLQCRHDMRLWRPDIFLAMGGYASVAPVMAARLLSIPIILHEANVIPGRANRFLSRWATAVALGFDETRSYLKHRNMVYTGMPLRKMKATNADSGWDVLRPGVFTILVMGGSRGAHTLNKVASKAMVDLHASGKSVQVIHLTGADDEQNIRAEYFSAGVPHIVFSFLRDIAQAYRRASFAVCRAGASTCAEIAQYGVPALLIPYPYAASGHQLANARVMEKAGAADVIEEKSFDDYWLADYISKLMTDKERLEKMKRAALRRTDENAAALLADLVLSMAKETIVDSNGRRK